MTETTHEKRTDGPELLRVPLYGNDIPEMKLAALDKARELYGQDAPLEIESVGTIRATVTPQIIAEQGKWNTTITVRCLRLPEGW